MGYKGPKGYSGGGGKYSSKGSSPKGSSFSKKVFTGATMVGIAGASVFGASHGNTGAKENEGRLRTISAQRFTTGGKRD